MTPNDIRTLKILEALEKDPVLTQRSLSKQLTISLGMVNAFTKRLVRKGYFKITTIPNNRIHYVLTPKGIAEKARLAYQYVHFSMQYYKAKRSKLKTLLSRLCLRNNVGIYLYGVSELGEIAYVTIKELDLKLSGVIDDDQIGNTFMGLRVKESSHLKQVSSQDIIIISKIDFGDDDYRSLSKNNIKIDRIIDLRL